MNNIPKITDADIEREFDWEKFNAEEKKKALAGAKYLSHSIKTFPYLTVKELRERLQDLPDLTPVLYQRIEDDYFNRDTGWRTVPLIWERPGDYSEYVKAFSAHGHKTEDGTIVFIINAHY